MDSMLDTLTNVVGILLIVLVTVQLSTQEAASRIADAVQKLDPAEIERIVKASADAKAAADRVQEQLDQLELPKQRNPAAEAAKLEAEAASAEAAAKEVVARAAAIEREKAAKSEAARRVAEEAAKKAAADMAKANAELKEAEEQRLALAVELEKTAVAIMPPAKEVRLPDPRPAPKDAKELRVLCREGKIWVVDIPMLQAQAQKRAAFIVKQKQLDPDGDNWLADGTVLETEFNKQPVKAGDFKMSLAATPQWVALVLERANGSGESADKAVRPAGELARLLKRHGPGDHYVRFFVWPDGFEAYLAARRFVAEQEFAAGWELVGSPDENRIGLGKYSIGQKPTEPAKPKPPQNVID